MNCHAFKQLMSRYFDGELSDVESRELEDHLKRCRECGDELKCMDQCIRVIRKVMKEETPPDSIRKYIFDKLNRRN